VVRALTEADDPEQTAGALRAAVADAGAREEARVGST